MKTTCKIAILENYALFSSGLKSLLHTSEELNVVAEGASPEILSILLQDGDPDIILINMIHCVNGGINTLKQTKEYFPGIPFLVIATIDYEENLQDLLNCGVKGLIYSNDTPEALISSIKTICMGENHFKLDRSTLTPSAERHQLKSFILSDREMEVLKLFCNGLTYKEIGDRLYISHRTVESHKKNILSKLKITSTAEMVKYATRNKLISN